jgi:N4-gp56 family major capsid protein
MNPTGTQQITYAVNNFYDRVLLERAVPAFIYTRFAQVRDIPEGNTNVIKFRRYTNLTAQLTPLNEGVTPTGSVLSSTDITATVKQYGDYVTLTDFVQMTTLDPILTETAELLGDEAGDTLDQLTRDILVAGTTVQYAQDNTARNQIANDGSDIVNTTDFLKIVRTLKNNKAKRVLAMIDPTPGIGTTPIMPAYIGFVHPDTTYDLKSMTGFVKISAYPSSTPILPDEVGSYDEIRFIESPNAKIFTGAGASSCNVYATMIIAMNAYGISRISGEALENIVKPLGSAGTADPLNQRATSGWKATFTAVRLNETFMVRYEHATSFS